MQMGTPSGPNLGQGVVGIPLAAGKAAAAPREPGEVEPPPPRLALASRT